MSKRAKKTASPRPQCPPHLEGEAREEWDRTCALLRRDELLDQADRGIIALYCIAWARWVEAEVKVKELGLMVAAPRTGAPITNPYLAIADKALSQAERLLAELGLTPTARAKSDRVPRQIGATTGPDRSGDVPGAEAWYLPPGQVGQA